MTTGKNKKAELSQRWRHDAPYILVPWNVKSRAQLTARLSHSQLSWMPARKYTVGDTQFLPILPWLPVRNDVCL